MLSRIMKKAHRIAKEKLEGDYQARMKIALKLAWKEEMEEKEMLEITTTTEKGTTVELWLEDNKIIGSIGEIAQNREIEVTKVDGYDVISFGTAKVDGKETRVLTKINDDIQNFIEKAKNRERQEELHFNVIETSNSGAWVTQDLLLEKEDKLLSNEQREKVAELERILGKQQRFAGASKEIKAKELPVEKGETYTPSEIMELCKEHSESWKREKEIEKEEEKHYEKCLQESRKTGENVEVDSYTVACNDPEKECNTDIIKIFVTPQGEEKTERIHTY